MSLVKFSKLSLAMYGSLGFYGGGGSITMGGDVGGVKVDELHPDGLGEDEPNKDEMKKPNPIKDACDGMCM